VIIIQIEKKNIQPHRCPVINAPTDGERNSFSHRITGFSQEWHFSTFPVQNYIFLSRAYCSRAGIITTHVLKLIIHRIDLRIILSLYITIGIGHAYYRVIHQIPKCNSALHCISYASILGNWGIATPDFGQGVVGALGCLRGSWTGLRKHYSLFCTESTSESVIFSSFFKKEIN